jgi:hypothetical protein
VSAKRKRLNRPCIASDLQEAIEELQKLSALASSGELKVEQLQIGLLHVYHHLNWAWNTRYVPASKQRALTHTEFRRWGRYPDRIEEL